MSSRKLKVAIFNEKEEILYDKILGRPFSFNQDKWEYTESLEEADWIFGHLHYLDCNLYYDYICKTPTFKKYARKFVFWSMHDFPEFAYREQDSVKFLCQPLFPEDINRNYRVIPTPLQMRHFEYEMIQDKEWIEKIRKTPKEYDFMYVGQIAYQGREFLKKLKLKKYYFEETVPIWHIQDTQERIDLNKAFCEKLAKSKFVFCPRGEGSSSFRLYQTLMSGSVPIISGQKEMPFKDEVDWENFAYFGENYPILIEKFDYNKMREQGMKFWDKYCHMVECDRFLFDKYLLRGI